MEKRRDLTLENAEELLGRRLEVKFESIKKKRKGYLIDIYNSENPFIVLEVRSGVFEDRMLSTVEHYKVI